MFSCLNTVYVFSFLFVGLKGKVCALYESQESQRTNGRIGEQ